VDEAHTLRIPRFDRARHAAFRPRDFGAKSGVMSIKDQVKKHGLQLLGDPRVAKLMQNEQFMRAMMTVVQVPGKVESFTTEQTERFAKAMRLATADEVKDLRRQVKNLEADLARLRKKLEA
jgi:hypothetical protein